MNAIPAELHPYIDINAALFPIPADTKIPSGIVSSWRHDWSRDPAQIHCWAAENPDCNWGMVADASGLIVVDIDVKRATPSEAWQTWAEVCASWGREVIPPSVATPSGGWHIYLKIPDGVDADRLRQPALKPGIIDIRANGFVLIPPSRIDGKNYAAYF